MASLRQDSRGNYVSRRKLPLDVRDEYGRLFGQHHEVKFFRPASTDRREAQRQFSEWSAEVDGNIIAIRAARDGTGQSLTPAQARKLAGDWYEWFTAKHADMSLEELEQRRDEIVDAFTDPPVGPVVTEEEYDQFSLDELWRNSPEVREAIRPLLADIGQTAQFLAAKRLALTSAARVLFLDWLWDDLFAALQKLKRRAEGDYGPDKYMERFPKEAQGRDSGMTSWQLFELWVKERKPAAGTVENWRYMFHTLNDDFEARSAGSIQPDEAEAWLLKCVTANNPADTKSG
jgi:hypothetical protein